MAFKYSAALMAAMVLASPALAQDNAVPSTLPESMDKATQAIADSVNDAAEAAETAATEAVEGAEKATTDAVAQVTGTTPATDAAPAANDSTAPAATDTAAPAADAPETAAPASDAAPAEPQVGAYYLKSTHTDWTIRCIKAGEGADPCELYQLLKDAEGNSVAEITMIPLGGKVAAGATLVAPLETDLMQGIGLQIDAGKARAYPFNFCAPVGCVSRMGFTDAELASFKRGNKATVTLLPFGADPKQPVQLGMSLSGFTAAYDELSTIAAAARAEAEAAAKAAAEAPAEKPAEPGAEAPAEKPAN